jgi:hypothetical protein
MLATQIGHTAWSSHGSNIGEVGIKIFGDRFSRGYIFGFVDAVLQRSGIPNDGDALALITIAHMRLFGDDLGPKMVGLSMKDQQDQVFKNGAVKGGREILAFLDDKSERPPPPFGLSDHLGTF